MNNLFYDSLPVCPKQELVEHIDEIWNNEDYCCERSLVVYKIKWTFV
jgi:hypothetical protein